MFQDKAPVHKLSKKNPAVTVFKMNKSKFYSYSLLYKHVVCSMYLYILDFQETITNPPMD